MNNDNDNELQSRRRTASYLAAYSHLLLGRAGRFDDFRERVDLILGGPRPTLGHLMQMTGSVRATGRPVLWIHHAAETLAVPNIALIAPIAGRTHVLENCMLLKRPRDDRALLVPDSFKLGAYSFSDAIDLRHLPKAPGRTFEASEAAIARTYGRLYEIEAEQNERGEEFALPTLARAA